MITDYRGKAFSSILKLLGTSGHVLVYQDQPANHNQRGDTHSKGKQKRKGKFVREANNIEDNMCGGTHAQRGGLTNSNINM